MFQAKRRQNGVVSSIATLMGALLIALIFQRRLWDRPTLDAPLWVHAWLLTVLLLLAVGLMLVVTAVLEGQTTLAGPRLSVVVMGCTWGFLTLVEPPLKNTSDDLIQSLERSLPEWVVRAGGVVWDIALVGAVVAVFIYAVSTG